MWHTEGIEMSVINYDLIAKAIEYAIYDNVEVGEFDIESATVRVYTTTATHDSNHVIKSVSAGNVHAGVSYQIGAIENTLMVSCTDKNVFDAIATRLMNNHNLVAEWN